MKIKLFFVVALIGMSSAVIGQTSYKQSIGLRLGSGYYDVVAAAYKTFMSPASAIEIDLGVRPYNNRNDKWVNLSASGSYQHHFDIKPVPGLKWFVGGGIVASHSFSTYDDRQGFNLGLFPTGGADYKFSKIPLAVSADVRPTFHIVEAYDYYNGFYPNVGVSARYTF
ncbi:hypothetical protein GCM10027051_00760 [Niabella terrae]